MPVSANTFQLTPGTPLTPQFAELVIRGHSLEPDGGSKPIVNIYHFVRISGPGSGTETELHTAIMALLASVLATALSEKYLPDDNSVRFMDDPINLGTFITNPVTGIVTGDRATNFVAAVIRKKTWARGRSYMGSNHYGPIGESETTLDNLSTAGITAFDDLRAALELFGTSSITTADGSAWKLMVLSTTLSNLTASPILVTGSVVKECILNRRLGTMKRRKDRTGPST